jgi:hypothetical protein
VTFSNVALSGGFIAHHRDDGSICHQVTEDGRVLVAGVACAAGEARFGGTVVQPACAAAVNPRRCTASANPSQRRRPAR